MSATAAAAALAVRERVSGSFVVGCRFLADEIVAGGSVVDDAVYFGVEFARETAQLRWGVLLLVAALVVFVALMSVKVIGPTEVGLVKKQLGVKKLTDDNPIAFKGEAGYQGRLLMPGLRFKLPLTAQRRASVPPPMQ